MEAGDLVFVREYGPISRLIRFFDKGRFNHCAIAVNSTQILEAEWNTVVRVIDNPYKDFEVVPLRLGENSRIKEFVKPNLGKHYDFEQVFRILLRILFKYRGFDRFNTTKEVICSELAGDYLEFVNIAKKGEELLAPNELYRSIKEMGY